MKTPSLIAAYRAFHSQAFTPILVDDGRDARTEIAACAAGGLNVVEISIRRADVRDIIPWTRSNYPDMFIVGASTIDDDRIVYNMRRRHPHLPTVDELADLGVHGFASVMGWSRESVERFAPSHLVIPSAMTPNEALDQTRWGAHFQKFHGSLLDVVRRVRSVAAFDYCPVFVTGGMTTERIPAAFDAGAVVVAAGFDLTLTGRRPDMDEADIAKVLVEIHRVAREAQVSSYPELARVETANDRDWLRALPHWHPFDAA